MDATSAPVGGADGLIHPDTEAAVAEAVRWAVAHGRKLRVRGSGHAPAASSSGDDPADLVLCLDRMNGIELIDPADRLVEVGAGIHLGRDPTAADFIHSAEGTMLDELAKRWGWTVSSTGGVTFQTLGGFLSSTSAGGGTSHSMLDHVVAVRLVDGRGQIREFTESDGEGPGLDGVLPSLGLLGVIVAVRLRCIPVFTIVGQEAIVDLDGAPMDLEGPGDENRPSLAEFFARVEYSRIEWWPQRGAERLLVWQAQAVPAQLGFRPTRYEEFTRYPVLGEALFSTLFVIFGNRAAPARVRQFLRRNADEVARALDLLFRAGRLTRGRRRMMSVVPLGLRALALAAPLLRMVGPLLERSLPWLVPAALKTVLPLDDHKPGVRSGEPQAFHDWAWEGLPSDNEANDVLLWTQFIELWVPLRRAAEVVTMLRAYFAEPADARESLRRTGLYAHELYSAPPASGWLHPGYTDGEDEWADGTLRFDVFWFGDNLEDPRERFYPQFWKLFADHGVPFRSHWGKELPAAGPDAPDSAGLLGAYPRWRDWLALRTELDPDGVFLTDYWRSRLGIPAARGTGPGRPERRAAVA